MPLYIDVHELKGVTAEDVAKAHALDVEKQGQHGVEYLKYWVNESCGKVFCLVNAPGADAANHVHREAHGLLAGRILEVEPEIAEAMMGGGQVNAGGAAVAAPGAGNGLDTGIRTILFTDIVGSTSLTQQLGDDAAMELVHLHDSVVLEALAALAGRKVKHTGDGVMASFASAVSAVRCAMRIQQELTRRGATATANGLKLRIGAAAGEPVEHQGDFFGSTVQLAARLCAHAQPEQIVVSNTVMELCVGKGLRFTDLGQIALKGFDQGIHAHAVAT
jgi:class 3 adenylate cyclase